MKMICYLPCGYPTISKSMEMAQLYVDSGVDTIEWCIPPIDAYADPPYIREKLKIAREGCSNYYRYFELIKEFKTKNTKVEVILLLYQEIIEEIGTNKIVELCTEVGIDTILSGNLNNTVIREELMEKGLKVSCSVNYTLLEEEIALACSTNGFVYMQALPSQTDLENGRGKETLKRGIDLLRKRGMTRDVYCGVGIRNPEDITFIKESGGQGFFLGSTILKYYNEPEKLSKMIQIYKEKAND